ncbi:hypothetical protein HPB51_021750 [Rhipicephalus microplus]|uniref:Uncharacterized protein n=1 Tax=Rhipicephalus microplus TaxID=6941 RepID=A0A9J6DQC6_RHIMP|nr:hypothetical protein HPB51_021750 [Rhipicephalus microplus]
MNIISLTRFAVHGLVPFVSPRCRYLYIFFIFPTGVGYAKPESPPPPYSLQTQDESYPPIESSPPPPYSLEPMGNAYSSFEDRSQPESRGDVEERSRELLTLVVNSESRLDERNFVSVVPYGAAFCRAGGGAGARHLSFPTGGQLTGCHCMSVGGGLRDMGGVLRTRSVDRCR